MAVLKDWMQEAANEIWHYAVNISNLGSPIEKTVDIIAKHSPMKDGIAYMPVPRCDGCKHWKPWERDKGNCEVYSPLFEYDIVLTNASFGCVLWEAK